MRPLRNLRRSDPTALPPSPRPFKPAATFTFPDSLRITGTAPFALWLLERFGVTPDHPDFLPEADADSDGMTTWQEYLADICPTDSSRFVTSTPSVPGGYNGFVPHAEMRFPRREVKVPACGVLPGDPGVGGWGSR